VKLINPELKGLFYAEKGTNPDDMRQRKEYLMSLKNIFIAKDTKVFNSLEEFRFEDRYMGLTHFSDITTATSYGSNVMDFREVIAKDFENRSEFRTFDKFQSIYNDVRHLVLNTEHQLQHAMPETSEYKMN
jgi:hypothetical protein